MVPAARVPPRSKVGMRNVRVCAVLWPGTKPVLWRDPICQDVPHAETTHLRYRSWIRRYIIVRKEPACGFSCECRCCVMSRPRTPTAVRARNEPRNETLDRAYHRRMSAQSTRGHDLDQARKPRLRHKYQPMHRRPCPGRSVSIDSSRARFRRNQSRVASTNLLTASAHEITHRASKREAARQPLPDTRH